MELKLARSGEEINANQSEARGSWKGNDYTIDLYFYLLIVNK